MVARVGIYGDLHGDGTPTAYDTELGEITDQDHEYAADLLNDLAEAGAVSWPSIVAQWFRKARYEAVLADRKARG